MKSTAEPAPGDSARRTPDSDLMPPAPSCVGCGTTVDVHLVGTTEGGPGSGAPRGPVYACDTCRPHYAYMPPERPARATLGSKRRWR